MSQVEIKAIQTPAPLEKRPWFPISRWIYDRRVHQQLADEALKREDLIANLDASVARINSRCLGVESEDYVGIPQLVFGGPVDLANIGTVKLKDVFYEPINRIESLSIYDVDGTPIELNPDKDGKTRGYSTKRDSATGNEVLILLGQLKKLAYIAQKVDTLAEGIVSATDLVAAVNKVQIEQMADFPEVNLQYKVAVLDGKTDEVDFVVSDGWVKKEAANLDPKDKRNYEKIIIVQNGSIAYVVTERYDYSFPYRKKFFNEGDIYNRLYLKSLTKVELNGAAYNPDSPDSARPIDLTADDFDYLNKVTEALPNAQPLYWRRYWGDYDTSHTHGVWKNWEHVQAHIQERKMQSKTYAQRLG